MGHFCPKPISPYTLEKIIGLTNSLATLGLLQCISGMSAHIYERVTPLLYPSRASLLYYGIVPWHKVCKFWSCTCAGWCAYDRLMFWDVACHDPWCCIAIYDVLWRSMLFYNLLGCCTYCANSWGGCMSVVVYINIVHIVPTIGGVICKLLFSLVLSISCQQLGECG